MSLNEGPHQILTISETPNDLVRSISIVNQDRQEHLLYTLHANKKGTQFELRYVDPKQCLGQSIGSISLHSLSSKIDISLHGRAFTMTKKDLLSSGYGFTEPAFGGFAQWKEASFLSSSSVLVDGNGTHIAQYCKKLKAVKSQLNSMLKTSSKSAGFEVFVVVQDQRFLDLIILTGIAEAEYKRKSNEDWRLSKKKGSSSDSIIEEIVVGALGG